MEVSKVGDKPVHHASAQDIFNSLSGSPIYSQILLQQNPNKGYLNFLQFLIDKNFYPERPEKVTMKKMAADFKSTPDKISKWLRQIYDDIFELNYEKPALFQKQINDLNSVLTLCFNDTAVIKYYDAAITQDLFPGILPYYEINEHADLHFTVNKQKPLFINNPNSKKDFYIEIEDINQNEDEITVDFKIPLKSVRFWPYCIKKNGTWTLQTLNRFSL